MNQMAAYVIDTSYLLELYAIPGKSTPEAITEVRKRLLSAAESGITALRHGTFDL